MSNEVMKQEVKSKKVTVRSLVITSVITFLFALAQIIFPSMIIKFIGFIVGTGFILIGVVSIIMYIMSKEKLVSTLSRGVIFTLAGLYFTFNPDVALGILSLLLGIFIILNGVVGLQFSLEAKKLNADKWKISLIFALVIILLGLFILFFPFSTTKLLIIYNGVFMLISSVLNLVSLFFNKPTVE